ncbi:response regulator [Noviherbaspirillum pedocola]|uniref:response regulator n=1 Tax=Noviherbaspirillum pedocola TaxID=2801341 RepID=UPI002D7F451D|nr:response regulator [Noviherbaspirillum pedocola]
MTKLIPDPTPNVLVVNDDPGSLIGLVGLLNQWEHDLGFETFSARSGEEALRHVLKHEFAVILLDVNMPGMSGFETAEAIHSRHASSLTPIIFVTAYSADEMNRLKGYEQGAVDYLFTPIVPEILRAKLSVFVALAKSKLAVSRQAEALDQQTRKLTAANELLQREISKRQIAEEKNKTTEAFLAMLGHELRNPLSAISSAATLLGLDGISMQKATTAKEIIQRQSGQLTRIVDDLLDLSRVMSGRIVLAKRALDLGALVRNCVDTLQISGRAESYRIELDVEPVFIHADPARMEQVVVNLIDNALKYTPLGGRIEISLKPLGEAVFFTVRDNGVGMSAELLPRIFDVFVQGERTLDRPQGGLGIGLSLVQQLVSQHEGEVNASSEGLGLGSELTVRLPRSTVQPTLADELPGATSQTKCRVLLIEDNVDGRDIMAMRLAALGHQVFTAEDGPRGIEIAERERPDVVLLDIGLPEMDGFAVARALRSNPATCDLKLVALTGYGLEEDRIRSLEAGFDMHLVKPVDQDRLTRALARNVAGHHASR